jgi:hypothetical protein
MSAIDGVPPGQLADIYPADPGAWNSQGAGSLATMGRYLAAGQDPNFTAHTFAGQTAQGRHHPFHDELSS